MRATGLLRTLLDLKHTVVRAFEFTDEGAIIDALPWAPHADRHRRNLVPPAP
jgi:hypothetical protein